MMVCPKCRHASRVLATRTVDSGTVRTRECSTKDPTDPGCGYQWTTIEREARMDYVEVRRVEREVLTGPMKRPMRRRK